VLVVVLSTSGHVLTQLMILYACDLPLITAMLPSLKPKEITTLHSYSLLLLTIAKYGLQSIIFSIASLVQSFHLMSVLNLYLSLLLLSSLTRFLSFTPIFCQNLVTYHLILIHLFTQSFSLIFNLLLMMRFLNSCLSLLPLIVTLTLYLLHSSSNVLLFSFLLSQISSIYHYLSGSFLINSKAVRSMHSSKNPIIIGKILATIILSHTCPFHLNSLKELQKIVP
jgi:hypothetical protein